MQFSWNDLEKIGMAWNHLEQFLLPVMLPPPDFLLPTLPVLELIAAKTKENRLPNEKKSLRDC